eukprot:7417533-Ditylum_brightwellii.AAC.1
MQAIWGDYGKKDIFIPQLINNYNHWMGGVDLVNQRISYYHPDICCFCNWCSATMDSHVRGHLHPK